MTNANDKLITRNLIINGSGFMNRIRTVKPNNGQPYVAVTMALEEGRVENAKDLHKTYLECRVVGTQALALLHEHFTDENGEVNADDDVTVRAAVDLAGCDVSTFAYTKGDKAGKTGVSLRSRLLSIHFLTINGDLVFTVKDDDDNSASAEVSESKTPDTDTDAETATEKAVDPSEPQADSTSTGTITDDVDEDNDQTSDAVLTLTDEDTATLLSNDVVELDKADPLFNEKRLCLKANDYGWDEEQVAWVKKQPNPANEVLDNPATVAA